MVNMIQMTIVLVASMRTKTGFSLKYIGNGVFITMRVFVC